MESASRGFCVWSCFVGPDQKTNSTFRRGCIALCASDDCAGVLCSAVVTSSWRADFGYVSFFCETIA